MSGGAEANKSGLAWEAWVKTFAAQQGFEIKNYAERQSCELAPQDRRIVWIRAPYETIFHITKTPKSDKAFTEFVIEYKNELVRVECKWQDSSGSVDEKYPFMYLNAVLTMEERTVVFAMGGEYFEKGKGAEVKKWLQEVCTNPPAWFSEEVRQNLKTRELLVRTPNNFAKWLRQRFPKT